MDKTVLLKYTSRVRTETENHYGPIFYLYESENLTGPLPTNTFLPGMHDMLCKFLGISEQLATKITNTRNREEFKSGKKILVLIKQNNIINDIAVLNLER